ncbi:MAG: M23 family metallopeptidase [Pseudomonadota bacterium]
MRIIGNTRRGIIAMASLSGVFVTACTATSPTVPPTNADRVTASAETTSATRVVVATPKTARRVVDTATPAVRPPLPIDTLNKEDRLNEQQGLARKASFVEAMDMVEERQKLFAGTPKGFSLAGQFSQAGFLVGTTAPGSTVRLDGMDVMVGADGTFALGFGRDSALTALLTVTSPDGVTERHTIELEDKTFPEQRIDGLDQSKVSGYTQAQLEKIGKDSALKKASRSKTHPQADFRGGFDWPVTGRISGVFGSRRILNGEPKRPHSGVDVARPTGTPIRAPAAGVITLAEEGMYFEGGLILLDHGHWVESAFLHLSRLDVEAGERVEKGQVIGAIGSTGRSTGPHLHWSIRWMGRLVDPQLAAGEMPTPQDQ